jgi:hypothetical protein
MKRLILVFFILSFCYASQRFQFEVISQFYLEQDEKNFIGYLSGMAVDEEENIFIVDNKNHNIKIYNKKGKLVRVFGKKGGGPGELVSPGRIDYDSGKYIVQDYGLARYIIFDKAFNEISRFYRLPGPCETFIVNGERVISNGYFGEGQGKEFKGLIMNFSGKILKKLLQLNTPKEDAWDRITNMLAFLDVSNKGEIFLVMAREVKIFKFSKKGELLLTFGKNPPYFSPCKKNRDFETMIFGTTSKEMIDAERRWRKAFSWVSGIFVLDDFLGIVIRNFNQKIGMWQSFVQIYDLKGELQQERIHLIELGTSSSGPLCYDFFYDSNHKDRVYFLEILDEDREPKYRFTIYRVLRK